MSDGRPKTTTLLWTQYNSLLVDNARLEAQNQAFQKRIEELETVGSDLLREGCGNTRGSISAHKRFAAALSPTQETDPG